LALKNAAQLAAIACSAAVPEVGADDNAAGADDDAAGLDDDAAGLDDVAAGLDDVELLLQAATLAASAHASPIERSDLRMLTP
jgi:hypothetical protein